ncbi:FecR domain-containing protein [Olivibacter ginsenosidimutans]|uniref:FecR domain-containing protein n=1 Tax=Olivibacter ginsenosidimutans TaxID=1176537 RepID=A0ABP9ARQ5_9SPHI
MDQQIRKLFTKYLHNRCTPDELQQLFQYLEQGQYWQEWDAALEKEKQLLLKIDRKSDVNPFQMQQLQERVMQQIRQQHAVEHQETSYRRTPGFSFRGIAASISLLLLGLLAYWYLPAPTLWIQSDIRAATAQQVKPGGNHAILKLADGKEISLTEAALGKLSESHGITATKTADGLLTFQVNASQSTSLDKESYQTIRTPRGGQYQIVLPDGSHVWLNAQSSLRFPTDFSAQKREVSLSGEAYFAVAPDKQAVPFSVKTDKQAVQVLGTEFNVTAYPDEMANNVCLVNGAVVVMNGVQSTQLKPGQLASVNDAQQPIVVKTVDPTNYIAWKQGLFSFQEEHIYSLMKKIARWYNVEVDYQGNMEGKVFSGTFSRFADVQDVLNVLQATGTIQLSLKERRIMVRP